MALKNMDDQGLSCPIEDIVKLTQAQEETDLIRILKELIGNILPNHEVTINKLSPCLKTNSPVEGNLLFFNPLEDENREHSLSELPHIIDCFKSGKQVELKNSQNQTELVIPIIHDQTYYGFLQITGNTIPPDYEDSLTPVLKVFSNQIYLINQNMRDALTGLLNRKALSSFIKRLNIEINSDKRRRGDESTSAFTDTCFVLVDIDHFKQVNDQYGHLQGDEVLLLFSKIMTELFRKNDCIFRYGGEEFALFLCDIDIENALSVLDRFREKIANYPFPQIGRQTISIGVTRIIPGEDLSITLDKADQALYYAKRNGRNQVFSYEQLVRENLIRKDEN